VGKRVLTGTSLVLLVALLLELDRHLPQGLTVWAVASLLALLAAWELGRMEGFRPHALSPALPLAALATAGIAWVGRAELAGTTFPLGGLLVLGVLAGALAWGLAPRGRALAARLSLWALAPLFGLMAIDQRWGTAGLACLVALSKVGDILGYFVGKAIGKRHPFPRLSPGKTVAGCVASMVGGVLVGLLLAVTGVLPGDGTGALAGASIGLLLNLAAQAGDLLESAVKRAAGVKDSSGLVGAAGGVLDVVDSLLLSVPMALLLWPLLL
jgi:phosphatidate cytidylyltransferase